MIGSVDVITSRTKKYPIDIIVLNKSMLNRERKSAAVANIQSKEHQNLCPRIKLFV